MLLRQHTNSVFIDIAFGANHQASFDKLISLLSWEQIGVKQS